MRAMLYTMTAMRERSTVTDEEDIELSSNMPGENSDPKGSEEDGRSKFTTARAFRWTANVAVDPRLHGPSGDLRCRNAGDRRSRRGDAQDRCRVDSGNQHS